MEVDEIVVSLILLDFFRKIFFSERFLYKRVFFVDFYFSFFFCYIVIWYIYLNLDNFCFFI